MQCSASWSFLEDFNLAAYQMSIIINIGGTDWDCWNCMGNKFIGKLVESWYSLSRWQGAAANGSWQVGISLWALQILIFKLSTVSTNIGFLTLRLWLIINTCKFICRAYWFGILQKWQTYVRLTVLFKCLFPSALPCHLPCMYFLSDCESVAAFRKIYACLSALNNSQKDIYVCLSEKKKTYKCLFACLSYPNKHVYVCLSAC